MKYDFTCILNRHGMDSVAVDAVDAEGCFPNVAVKDGFDRIPMWVADMNFPAVPSITEALVRRSSHPAFGYFDIRSEYYDEIIRWQETRNGVKNLQKESIGYENGVLGGVVSALRVLCSEGDPVLLHSPTYIGFSGALKNNGFRPVHSPLKKDESGIWRMDFQDMEEKIVREHIHTAIFCSPHNPTGRVWEMQELAEAMELFRKHDVFVISDEIWSDIILNGHRHIPVQSVSGDARNRTVAFYAPSKTFNLAGLVGSYHIIYNRYLSDRILKQSSLCHYNECNVLSMWALIGAYGKEGQDWVDELKTVLSGNVNFACDYIAQNFSGVSLSKPQGTYMLFLDCTKWCADHNTPFDVLLQKGIEYGVIWQDGRPFFGENCIRMNLALPLSRVREAFSRLDRYVFNA